MSERKTMNDVWFYVDRANEALKALGIDDKKLHVYQAYGMKRLAWLYDSSAMDDLGFNGSVRDVYDQAYAIAQTLEAIVRNNATTREYELCAKYDGRKSFYGKARVVETATTKKLYSYDTLVCVVRNGEAFRVDGQPESMTTARHMSEFLCQTVGMLDGHQYSKRDLLALPTTTIK